MKQILDKAHDTLGGILDIITQILLFAYGAYCLIEQQFINAALLFGVLGVWCISCALGKIHEMIKDFIAHERGEG